MNYKNILFIICLMVALSGCTQKITRISGTSHIGSEQRFDRNYELGQKMTAYVGQPIIKVKDYNVNRFKKSEMRASHDFSISGGGVTITGTKDETYAIEGETILNGVTYMVVKVPWPDNGGHFDLLINPDGTVHSKVINYMNQFGKHVVMVFTFELSPDALHFLRVEQEEIDVSSGYVNYELMYSGTDSDSITLTYREYTSENMARPAFFQNLVYEKGQGQIRFRDIVLNVHEVTNQEIIYTVVSDGR